MIQALIALSGNEQGGYEEPRRIYVFLSLQ